MKTLFCLFVLITAFSCYSQQLQVHYDFGDNRKYVTTTLEMFKNDKLGSTFWFVDMDYNSGSQNKSNSLAYWEIARYFTTPFLNSKLSTTIQYNDGTSSSFGPLHSAWLGGISFPLNLGFLTVNTDLLYRYMDISQSPDWQLTFVWFKSLINDRIHFAGYLDVWTQDMEPDFDKKLVIQMEPQVWYVLNSTFSIGSEVEISYNFIYPYNQWEMMPTLGLKWNF